MAEMQGDPYKGVWRWAWRRVFQRHVQGVGGFVIFPFATGAIVTWVTSSHLSNHLNPYAILGLSVAAGFVLIVLVFGVFALAIAPYQQRKVLRVSLKDKDEEVAQFRLKRLDADHEEGIKETLRSVEQRIIKSETVGIGSVEMSSLIGHVPTVVPLIEDWNEKSSLNTYIGKSLEARSEKAIAEFDYLVYSHEALKDIVGFAMYKASTPGFGPPYPIEWAPIIQAVPDEIRLVGRTQGFVARANNDVTREQAMERIQLFLDDVLSWKEVALYGDIPRNEALRVSRERLLEGLGGLLAKHGYLVGSGCSRCPNGPLAALS